MNRPKPTANQVPLFTTTGAPVLVQIVKIVAEVLKDRPCVVYLFGSRANNSARSTSDYDIAMLAEQELASELSILRFQLEEANIPYTVDVIDLRSVAPDFRQRVETEGQVIWKS